MRGASERIVPENWRRRHVAAVIAATGEQPPPSPHQSVRRKRRQQPLATSSPAVTEDSSSTSRNSGGDGVSSSRPAFSASASASTAASPSLAVSPSGSASDSASASSSAAPAVCYRCRVVVHQQSFSEDEAIFNPQRFPALVVGDIVSISKASQPTAAATAGSSLPSSAAAAPAAVPPSTSLLVRVSRLSALKGNIECSLLSSLASAFELQARDEVELCRVQAADVALDSVELSFDRAFIGRSDHWRIRAALQLQTVYCSKPVVVEGMRLRIDEMSRRLGGAAGGGQRRVSSGLVTAATRLTFRSRSARLLFLLCLSSEMWQHADDGEIHFEKVVGFLRLLFAQWRQTHVTHALSLVLSSRTHALTAQHSSSAPHQAQQQREEETREEEAGRSAASGSASASASPVLWSLDSAGRLYADHYELVVDGDSPDDSEGEAEARQWGDSILRDVKTAFHSHSARMRWGSQTRIAREHIVRPAAGLSSSSPPPPHYAAAPFTATLTASSSVDGNVLEAINCAVSIFDKHWLDRDLSRTGQNLVVLSAGEGVHAVSASLAQLTKQRMVDGGIGCDLICMTRPPMHAVPLFLFDSAAMTDPHAFFHAASASASASSHWPPLRSAAFDIPHWISIFFYDYRQQQLQEAEAAGQGGAKAPQSERDEDGEEGGGGGFVSLSSCRLPDFRPSDAFLGRWLFASRASAASSSSCPPSSLPSLPPPAFGARYSPYDGRAQPQRTAAAAAEDPRACQAQDDALFAFRSEQREQQQAARSSSQRLARAEAAAAAASPHGRASPSLLLSSSPAVTWSLTFARRWAHLYSVRDDAAIRLFAPNWKSLCKPAMLPLTVDYLQSADELRLSHVEYHYALSLQDDDNNAALLEEIICQRQAHDYQNVTQSRAQHAPPASRSTTAASLSAPSAAATARISITLAAVRRREKKQRAEREQLEQQQRTVQAEQSGRDEEGSSSADSDELRSRREGGGGGSLLSPSVSSASPSASAPPAPVVYYFSLRNQVHRLSYDAPSHTIAVKRFVDRRVLVEHNTLSGRVYLYYLLSPLARCFLPCRRSIEPSVDDIDWNYADQLLADQREQLEYHDKLRYRRVRFAMLPPRTAPGLTPSAAACRERLQAMQQLWQAMLKKTPQQLRITLAQPTRRQMGEHAATQQQPQAGEEGDRAAAGASIATAGSGEAEEESWEVDGLQLGADDGSQSRSASAPSAADVDHVLCSDVGFAVRCLRTETVKVHLPSSFTHSSQSSPSSGRASAASAASLSPPPLLPRREWFFLQYEALFHPLCCWHLEVHWLTATGVHIDGWCRQMQKKAERRGIATVRIPAQQHIDTADAFHQPLHIPLQPAALLPLVHAAMAKEWEFVLDGIYHGRRSFLHRSGCCLVRTLSDGFLFLTQHTQHSQQPTASAAAAGAAGPAAAAGGAELPPRHTAALVAQLYSGIALYCQQLQSVHGCLQAALLAVEAAAGEGLLL